jgi:hypothetical protein
MLFRVPGRMGGAWALLGASMIFSSSLSTASIKSSADLSQKRPAMACVNMCLQLVTGVGGGVGGWGWGGGTACECMKEQGWALLGANMIFSSSLSTASIKSSADLSQKRPAVACVHIEG